MRFAALLISASVATLGWCDQALAQDDQTAADVSEVMITAERRNTNVMVTPIAATVLSGVALEEKGVTSVDQLQFITPGATVNNFGQGIDFNIRGIGKAEHNTQTTTGVITYRDGVATFPGYFTGEPYYDIASVEVLRGPQGTFVGQNATGGAVFVNSRDPAIGGGHSGYILGQIGNYSEFGLQGAINLPVSDTFAARVAFNAAGRESFYNITGPVSGNDEPRFYSVRLGLLWRPADDISFLLKFDYNDLNFGAYNADPVIATNDPFDITANADLQARDRFGRVTLKIDKTFANGIILRSITGYQGGNSLYAADLDGTSAAGWTFRDSVDETIWSQEFNLISPDTGRLSWVLGLYAQTDEYDFLPGEFLIATPPGSVFTEYRLEGTNPKRTLAAFGQLTFKFTDRLALQLGARYSSARTTNHVSVLQYGTPIVQEQTAAFSNFAGKIALNWTINDHHFVYAFAATGFRPGGLNVPVNSSALPPFDEELVTSYEVGWKAGYYDGRLRVQLDAYYNDYKNFQVIIGYPAFPVFGIELNNANPTKIYGFEAQVEAVFGRFSLDAGLGLMKSSLGEFYATDPRVAAVGACDPLIGPASASCINLSGRDQTYAPEFTFNIGAQYVLELPNGDSLTPRLNYGHVSSQWATLFENVARGDLVGERNIFNGQIAWVHQGLVVTIYGTNITDQRYTGAMNSGLRFAGPPRQFGVRVLKIF